MYQSDQSMFKYNYQFMNSETIMIHSHRRYIKEKTNQFIPYHRLSSKRLSQAHIKPISRNQQSIQNQNETSIMLDSAADNQQTSLCNNLNLLSIQGKQKKIFRSQDNLMKRLNKKRASLGKIKSIQLLSPKPETTSKDGKKHFSVKKIKINHSSLEKSKNECKSEVLDEQVESDTQKKKPSFDALKIRSDNNLRNTLKKTSSSKLKIKVKDPFQRKMKLDNEFKDQSDIFKNQSSFLSTINQDQFKQILSQLDM